MTQSEKTQILRQKIQTMHDKGRSAQYMRNALNVSRDVIYYHRKQMGLNHPYARNITIIKQRRQIKEMARKNVSYKAISEQMGISKNAVKNIVHDSDSINNRAIEDVLANPVNKLLARRWT